MNVLLDTNILTRWVNTVDSQHPEAVECLRRLRTSGHVPTIVPQNLYEFWVVATRPIAVNGLWNQRLLEPFLSRQRAIASRFLESLNWHSHWVTALQRSPKHGSSLRTSRSLVNRQATGRYDGLELEA